MITVLGKAKFLSFRFLNFEFFVISSLERIYTLERKQIKDGGAVEKKNWETSENSKRIKHLFHVSPEGSFTRRLARDRVGFDFCERPLKIALPLFHSTSLSLVLGLLLNQSTVLVKGKSVCLPRQQQP